MTNQNNQMTMIDLTKGWDEDGVITGPYMASVVAPIAEVNEQFIPTDVCTWEITAQIRWVDDMYGNAQLQYELEVSDRPETMLLYDSRESLEDAYRHHVSEKKNELAAARVANIRSQMLADINWSL